MSKKKVFSFQKMQKNVFAANCFLVTSRGGAGWQWVLEDALEAEGLGGLLYAEFRMGGPHEFQELFGVLTDEGLGVVASDVVPLDAVLIDVVQDA